jgi:NTP pyrophosphatase (non-canonical NTP hydrolase)
MADKKHENPVTRTVEETGETADATIKETGKLAGSAMTTAGKTVESGERAVTGVASEGIRDVRKVGGEAGDLAKDTAKGTLDAADEIASKGGGMAKKAAENIAATPHDVAKSAWTGKPESEKK